MLDLDNVVTTYGSIEALKGITLSVPEGGIVSLIGANGAGKSTTLMTVSGVQTPVGGEIRFRGELISGLKPHEIAARGIAHVPEGRRIFPRLSVREHLEMGAFLRSASSDDWERVFTLFPVLKERLGQPGGTLSGGEQQMLAIGRALMARPALILLDEPSLGLAPILVSKIFRMIREINREGLAVLLVEQNAKAALSLSSRAYVLETGRIVASGPSADLLNDPAVQEAYLGVKRRGGAAA
ncbi:MAG: ABC transporter ATP-binding protein [Nitrospirae bacterium]|nr:ABC transporter ATP-binding protein [Nitrospirota bacterium]